MRQLVEGGHTLEELSRSVAGGTLLAEPVERDGHLPAGQPEAENESGPAITGRVKWFDSIKGYGFVVPDGGGGDILIHYNLLVPFGCKTLPEGTEIELQVRKGARGCHGTRILRLDLTEGTLLPPPPHKAVPYGTAGERHAARLDIRAGSGDSEPVEVLWFNRARGYGFLLRGDGVTQIFIHMETVRNSGFESLYPQQHLQARVAEGPRGPFAAALWP